MMNTANNVYEIQIIRKAIANHLDRILPSDGNKALYLIEYQINDLVWNISTSIYRQSGYKVDFPLVRDIANNRIESLKLLAAKQAEEARKKAEAETGRRKEEEAKRIEEARREKEDDQRRKAEEERKQWIQEARQEAEKESVKAGKTYQSNRINWEIFEKVKNIVVERLEVESDRVNPDASLAEDLGCSVFDMEELIMAIKEEFDIESLKHNFVKYRPLFSSAQEDEFVYSDVTVEDIVELILEKHLDTAE